MLMLTVLSVVADCVSVVASVQASTVCCCCRQLGLLVELFSADDVSLYMLPIVFTLAYDKVAQVRLKAFSAVRKRLCSTDDLCLLDFLLKL